MNLRVARVAVEALSPTQVVTGSGELGALALEGWRGGLAIHPVRAKVGREQTQELGRRLLGEQLDAMMIVGGDGTMADVAEMCLDQAGSPPLLGVGVGSTNVGRLITCTGEAASRLHPGRLRAETVGTILASCNGQRLGVGFNDAVIGFTVVGTLAGRARDLDAAKKREGVDVLGTPKGIGTQGTRVVRIGPKGRRLIASGRSVGSVVLGFAERSFFGKAVTGGICLSTLTGLPAGLLVCGRPLVRVELEAKAFLQWPPLMSWFIGVDEGSRILIEHARRGAALCADGTPLQVLRTSDRVELAVRRAAMTVLRMGA